MTPVTTQNLNTVEGIMKKSKAILARHPYPDDLRSVVVIGTLTQIIEHHEAMLLLMRNDIIGSALALVRCIVEGVYRGLWINFCATDAQIQDFERHDRLPVNMTQMALAIDAKYHAEGFFEDFRARSWAALCSYTHTGMLQLGRRFTGATAKPAYTDEEVFEVTTTATTCILLLAGKFLAVQKYDGDCREVEALIGTYGPAAANKKLQPGA
jgi:hypothetical protein